MTPASEGEVTQQLQQPPSSQLPYIPDSVLKSLQPSSAATLPSSATHHPERSLSSTFSTASLGRRRKKSFNSLRGGTGSELAAQRADLDERVAYLEQELTRYKTYSRLLEAELNRLQCLSPQAPPSPQPMVFGTSPQIRGYWQVCAGPGELPEEPSGSESGTLVTGLPPPPVPSKRGFSPSMGGIRQSRVHRMQYRQYQMQRRQQQQQQQFYNSVPVPSSPISTIVQNPHMEGEKKSPTESQLLETQPQQPAAFYEVL